MRRIFSKLARNNDVDPCSESSGQDRKYFWNDTRSVVRILHCLGISYVVAFCTAVNFAFLFLGLPSMYEKNDSRLFRGQLIAWFMFFNIMSNYFLILIHAKKSFLGPGMIKSLPFRSADKPFPSPDWSATNAANETETSDWTKCSHCEIKVPPRTRHCAVCKTCVLKRDHHCYFTGCCIGFYNQKYFIIFCFYGIIGAIYGMYHLDHYLQIHFVSFFSTKIYYYFMPYLVVTWMLGSTSYSIICVIFLFFLHITSFSASLYYFFYQMLLIIRGQTSYEFFKRRQPYDMTVWENFRSVFGPYWLISFLIPVPVLLNEGDGTKWRLNHKYN